MSLKKEFLSGVFFTAVAKYSGMLVALCVTAVLSRLLTPNDFGVVGVATVIIAFFNILGDIGIGPAIIQHDSLNKNDLREIHTFTTYIGIFLAIIFFSCSWLIANLYESQILVRVCQYLSLSIIFTCWGIVPTNLQYKLKRFRRIALITLSVQIIVGILSIAYAYFGGGVYALVFSSVASSFLLALIYNINANLKCKLKIGIGSLQKIMSFSTYQFLFNILVYFSRNIDKLLIGRYIGLTSLGYYEKSYRLMMLPLQNITFVINPVMLPIFSSLQYDLTELGRKYMRLLQALSYISFPISVILFFCSPELIIGIFGEQWAQSIIPLQILSFTVGLQILTSTTGSIYQAANATKQLLITGCWGAAFMITGFIFSIYYWGTLEAVCYAYLLAQLANTVQCFYLLFKTLGMKSYKPLMSFIKPLIISIFIFILMWYQQQFIPSIGCWLILLLKVILGVLLMLLGIQLFSPYNIMTIARNILKFKK